MDHKISEDFIEEVRRQADIVEIISEHVVLKRTGKNYQGLCPFHSEKTPSFNVNPDRQMFYCFGCHTGGNVFSFLMKKEGLAFIEALKKVAGKYGMELPERELSPEETKNEAQRSRWREIHEWAARYYHDVLLHRPEGQAGLTYFEHRGIGSEVIRDFRLGFAPDRWDGLIRELADKGVAPEELAQFGLAVRRETSEQEISYYDRFRNRVIYTILDVKGAPIAFGGRVLDDSTPKYLNSPETKFFHKGRNLYGIHLASRGIREAGYSLLLEGYMDTIAAQRAGFTNAVASLGTALTKDQARLLKKYAGKIVIGYDSDKAGIQAALRAGEILLDEGLNIQVLLFEDAKDPDEFLKKHTVAEFRKKLENTITFIEFKYKMLIRDTPLRTIPDKAELIRKLAPDILKVPSIVEKEGYERYLSLELGLTLEAVQHEIDSLTKKTRGNRGNPEIFSQQQDISVKKRNTIEGTDIDSFQESYVHLGVFRAEQTILRIILENPNYKNQVADNLDQEFWRLQEHRYIFENFPENSLNLIDNDSWYEKVQRRLAEIYELSIDFDKADMLLKDCIALIKETKKKETIEDLQAKMILLEKSGDMAGALALLQEIGERLKRGEK
ncbi:MULTISPECIES: DNA primase [unclassified Dehalobacter]|uniref:DNA primase n=1 Tax=unclassified Dehalobacter TaxID=2635733 RepID=UPI000E6CF30C|nr:MULTISPECIES: DNA primase [unclassified Dehalobacter]RJE47137.1 DNA primase [Dehalobacter sp. MCB1]TCX53701.1 DNA primase [Dehalobacter sp. 14DCB1]TCX55004.1 DNA primase [Dehalobacter sp. 12DCB1]